MKSFSLNSPDMPEDPQLTQEQERLLDLALGKGSLPGGDSELGTAAFDLRHFVQETKSSLSQFDSVAASKLQAATDQISDACQDQVATPGIVGGIVLRFDFFKTCLKNNVALRIAAASLLVHLTALPVLAWLAFTEPAPRFINIKVEVPPVVMTEEPGEETIEVPLISEDEDLGDLNSVLDEK